MPTIKPIHSALISVYHKDGLESIIEYLEKQQVTIYSTGGTQKFIESLGVDVVPVEELTSYPSILGGRVKTLHPKVFGGILARRDNDIDVEEIQEYHIPEIDLVIVDLYPFEETVASGAPENEIIEKIDIGGISLIRATAKNFRDTAIVSHRGQYDKFLQMLMDHQGGTLLENRKELAKEAFDVSSHYDAQIFSWIAGAHETDVLKISESDHTPLRYGENPHQKGSYFGKLDDVLHQHHGKALSYNNILDVDAALRLIQEFWKESPTIAIIKHNNACGLATRLNLVDAWEKALEADSVSAFGGIIVANQKMDARVAEEIDKIFVEVVIAPDFDEKALEILKGKKNRIILQIRKLPIERPQVRTALSGYLVQDDDFTTENATDFDQVTDKKASLSEMTDMVFANKIVKHTKSNAIVIAKKGQLLASGTGQTSRVDALNQALKKAAHFKLDVKGAVMASDAFFPFPDCVEIAGNAGITAVIQPGGSIKDQLSIDYCNAHDLAMVMTGNRHFKH